MAKPQRYGGELGKREKTMKREGKEVVEMLNRRDNCSWT